MRDHLRPNACDTLPPTARGRTDRVIDVLYLIDSLGHGGAEQSLLSLVSQMPPGRFRGHLAWLFDDDRLLEQFQPHMATLLPLHAQNTASGLAKATLTLARWIRRHRPDVLSAQLIASQLVARGAALAGGRLPVVTTWQNPIYAEEATWDLGGPRQRRVIRWLDRTSGQLDRHTIAVSEFVAASCGRELAVSPERISVIYNAVEPSRYEPVSPALVEQTRTELGVGPTDRLLLSVARMVPQKRQADLIDAMPLILRETPDAVLLLVGKGPHEDALRERARASAACERIRFLGLRRDVPTLMQVADVFVFPSAFEGLSVALGESLANGMPAVASDIPQNREVGDGLASVRFSRVGDVDALSRAILELLQDLPGAKAAAERARSRIRERFHPTSLAMQFAAVLESAATPALAREVSL